MWIAAAAALLHACATPAEEGREEVVDFVAPTVTIRAPEEGAVVSGVVTLDLAIDDDVGATAMQLEVDGSAVLTVEEEPLLLTWDTPAFANGDHQLRVQVADAAGHVGEAVVSVVVQNDGPDPGWIKITSPPEGAVVCGEIPLEVWVGAPATQVRMYTDGHGWEPDSEPPYDWMMETDTRADGIHVIQAIADFADGTSVSDVVSIETMNSGDACDAWPDIFLGEPDQFEFVSAEHEVAIFATDDGALEFLQATWR